MSMINDIQTMHDKYEVLRWAAENPDKLQDLGKLRMVMLTEEFNETVEAFAASDAEEVIDGLIDIIVIAIGTLDIFGVDVQEAWDLVYKANMSKEVGVKEGRPNPLGLPDLIKPEGWTAPCHRSNHGKTNYFLPAGVE